MEKFIVLEQERFYSEDDATELPSNWQMCLCYGFDELAKWGGYKPNVIDEELKIVDDPLTIVPMYSDDGGITATVLAYAAINANTKQPDKAFFVLDYIFGLEFQQTSPVFQLLCTDALPVHMDLLAMECPLQYHYNTPMLGGYYLEDGTYEEWCEARDSITDAVFADEVYYTLEAMYNKCSYAERKGESYDGIVADTYDALKQLVSE